MTILRYYQLTAQEGRGNELRTALADLAQKVTPLSGCEGVELYQDEAAPSTFIFIERWQSREHHAEGGKALGKEAFGPVMACLSEPPIARYLNICDFE